MNINKEVCRKCPHFMDEDDNGVIRCDQVIIKYRWRLSEFRGLPVDCPNKEKHEEKNDGIRT